MIVPSVTDWLMVIITGIYMVVTIAIFIANLITANASKKQLKDSQEQFEESNRLAGIPYLQVELARSDNVDFDIKLPPSIDEDIENASLPYESPKVIIKNVGNGSATNMIYSFSYDDSEIIETDMFPISAIMKGDNYCFLCIIPKKITTAKWEMQYDDFVGNQYEQSVILHFESNKLVACENDMPRLVGE